MPRSQAAAFWTRVQRSGSCLLWTGARDHKRGYGNLTVTTTAEGRRQERAHRHAWKLTFGPIPKGLYVCHHCDNPSCVNPEHLFLGTAKDNVRDMVRKGRATFGDYQRAKTHCPRGHEYTPDNTIRTNGGTGRSCRTCGRIRSRIAGRRARESRRGGFTEGSSRD